MTKEAPAAGKRPITADDLFSVALLSDPQPSPDGRQIAYVVTTLDQEEDTYKASIWLVPTTGGAPRQLTSGTARDTSPRWSPDGQTIAFVSNRPGLPLPPDEDEDKKPGSKSKTKSEKPDKPKPQIWLIPVGGGESRQLTNQRHGASSAVWSPDGRQIAFSSSVKYRPAETAEPKGHLAQIADERVITNMRYRADGLGFTDHPEQLWVIPVDGGDATQLTEGDTSIDQPTWSPDGRQIVFVANRTEERDRNLIQILYAVPAAGGSIRCLASGDYSFDSPAFSPDGREIAVFGLDQPGLNFASDDHLWTVPAGGGEPVDRTPAVERSLRDTGMSDLHISTDVRPVWSPQGDSVYALVSDHGSTHIHKLSLKTGKSTPVTRGSRRIASVVLAGKRLVYTAGDANHLPELMSCDLNGRDERQLSDHNRQFHLEVALSPATEFTYASSSDGRQIQGWYLTPPGFDPKGLVKYPMILQIHGGPHAMYGQSIFHEMQLMAARGYVVAFTNPRGSAGYGEEFNTCTRATWGESDMPDVMSGLDAMLATGFIDEARVGVTGGSYGGYLTNWIVGHTDRFKAAVTQRCVANFHSFYGTSDIGFDFGEFEFGGTPWADTDLLLKHSPFTYVANITTPLLIIHNEQDLRCPIEQAEQLYIALKRLDREVAFVRIPDENHNLSRTGTPSRRLARLHHLIGWFDYHL